MEIRAIQGRSSLEKMTQSAEMQDVGKRTRKSRPKVRSGCVTCKARRVKCDETKPTCLRCRQSGHYCDGYQKAVVPTRIFIPKLQPDFQPILYQPSTTWIQSPDEDRYFRFFTGTMAPQLAGYFDCELWNRLILQACQQNVAVRHTIIAMAASKSAADAAQNEESDRDIQLRHRYALRQYSKAIRSMRDAAINERQDLRMTLITSIVIFCFEMLHGNREAAVKQVVIGLDLIDHELTRKRSVRDGSLRIKNVEDELVRTFGRLDVQVMSLIDPRPPSRHADLRDYGSDVMAQMPAAFESLADAKIYLGIAMQRLLHLMASLTPESHSVGCLNLDLLTCIPDWCIDEREKYLEEHEQWHRAFTPLLRDTQESDKNYLGVMALELQYSVSYFASAVIRTFDEPWPDTRKFMPMFRSMVSMAKMVLNDPNVDRDRGVFSFDIQIICPLHAVAWRCPLRALRKEAVNLLLSTHRREGVWDSMLAGKLTGWIMKLEEENCRDVEGEYFPEHLRSSGVDILEFDYEGRWLRARCKLPDKETLQWGTRETIITW